jgi:hypothetical protein
VSAPIPHDVRTMPFCSPPRAVGIPRSFNAATMVRSDVTPAACSSPARWHALYGPVRCLKLAAPKVERVGLTTISP